MFGDNNQDQNTQAPTTTDVPDMNPAMQPGDKPFTSDAPVVQGMTAPVVEPTGAPLTSDLPATTNVVDTTKPDGGDGIDITASEPASADDTVQADEDNGVPSRSSDTSDHDLVELKQKALQQLSPLVDHLDQTPEEKFKTTMMMIQASDDHSLIKSAYEAAQQIPDEKTKAQALLDIINEINYFTQQKS